MFACNLRAHVAAGRGGDRGTYRSGGYAAGEKDRAN